MKHAHTNYLIHETSPYLLQHAHNPVDWYAWGEEAFEEARINNKPILLSIGYSACHWCHVMERECFENDAIAAQMNQLFVNIKVDREERPDLDEIYMNAVQMLTGRGGWPMTVFLTPERKPFYGGTYFPPEDRGGMPGFPRVLTGVAQAFRERPADVEKSVQQILVNLQQMSHTPHAQKNFSGGIVGKSVEKLSSAYDSEYGGFGKAPKFPNPGVYELFLRHFHASKSERALDMVVNTLTKMAQGGIYDHLGGGFHRYSVDAKWLVPHFEKMLYDNAQLVRIYARAYTVTENELFKTVVQESVDYLLREMLHADGGFYSTQDADSEGEEGKFFVWSEAEIGQLLGEDDATVFGRIYDVTEQGNFEEKNILHPILTIEQASKYFRQEPREITAIIDRAKRILFAARDKRVKPFRDEKIISGWNGLMLSGLAAAIRIAPKPEYITAAEKTVEFLFKKMWRNSFLLHVYKDNHAKLLGFLDDYAFVALGLLDLYEALFEPRWLERALALAEIMLREFWDENGSGFFFTGNSHEPLISRAKPVFDASIPSGNASAAEVLLRLAHLTGNTSYAERAEKILHSYYDAMESQPFGFAHLLCALDFHLRKPRSVVLVGDPKEAATEEILRRIFAGYHPDMVFQLVRSGESLDAISPLLAGKTQLAGKPTAYVCRDFTCSAPVNSWAELRTLIEA